MRYPIPLSSQVTGFKRECSRGGQESVSPDAAVPHFCRDFWHLTDVLCGRLNVGFQGSVKVNAIAQRHAETFTRNDSRETGTNISPLSR
jgi:hypothetical protein